MSILGVDLPVDLPYEFPDVLVYSSQRSFCFMWDQKVLVTQSSNIVHCDQHIQNLYVQIFKPFWTLYPCTNWLFFIFCHREFRKIIITQKVLVAQSSNIVHCNQHIQKHIHADFQTFPNTFSLYKLTFFIFCQGSSVNSQKLHIFLNLTGKNALKWLELCVFRVWGFQIQCHRFQVSTISSSWKFKISVDK